MRVERFTANIAEHPSTPAHHHTVRHPARLPGCAAQRNLSDHAGGATGDADIATIHKQAGIFVDNIDEYLIHYINFSYLRRNEVHERFVRIWHAGQVGAWLALRRLHGINPHVRIFVSIRKEAYQHAAQNEPQFSNLRSFRRELRYRIEDIKQIIENNIAIASKSDLVDLEQ